MQECEGDVNFVESRSVLLSTRERERDIEELDIHGHFIANLCKVLWDMKEMGFHMVLGIDANDVICNGSVSAALTDIGITEVDITNHKGESVPATSSNN